MPQINHDKGAERIRAREVEEGWLPLDPCTPLKKAEITADPAVDGHVLQVDEQSTSLAEVPGSLRVEVFEPAAGTRLQNRWKRRR